MYFWDHRQLCSDYRFFRYCWRLRENISADRNCRGCRRRCLLGCTHHGVDVVTASFFSALAIAFIAHLFARVFKAPVTVFLTAGILPTVPGAGMYRIAYSIIANDRAGCAYYLLQTLEIAGMIALANFIVDAIFRVPSPCQGGTVKI